MTTTTLDTPKKEPVIPTDIYTHYPTEAEKTASVEQAYNPFEMIGLVNSVKADINVLHESLRKKSNIFIFGAGGTTSWFLPKLLKIYNDAFLKVPSLAYDLEIVLIDADIV